MEYLSRLFAESLESQEFTYHDEYTRCQGLHIFILCIMLKKTIFDKSFFFENILHSPFYRRSED